MDLLNLIIPGPGPVMAQASFCCGHGHYCIAPACDLDVTGTPCQDWAPNGNRLGREGPQWKVFLAWVTVILAQQLPIVVHENVPQFDVNILFELLGHMYFICPLVIDCESLGFRLISRKRRYTIMYHKAKTQVLLDPASLCSNLLSRLLPALPSMAQTISDCYLADLEELAQEVAELCFSLNMDVTFALLNLTLLLTPGERDRLIHYMALWFQRFGVCASQCKDAIFNLGDNPGAGYVTWSASSGRIPGLRTQNAKYWVPFLSRWLTNKELLACMGLPVYPALAQAAGVPLMNVRPGPEARHMLGNMMHVASVGTAMAVALVCCKLVR